MENEERVGKVHVSGLLLLQALGFPEDWEIKSVGPVKPFRGEIEFVISGMAFPERNQDGSAKDCMIIGEKSYVRFEVKEL